jgi:hypothetical protein
LVIAAIAVSFFASVANIIVIVILIVTVVGVLGVVVMNNFTHSYSSIQLLDFLQDNICCRPSSNN